MAKGEVNRNLLFGLLALQNGFIDQSALVAAFHGWVRDKNRSLAAYLIDRGDLEKDHKSAIDALVELHQKDDGQSVERGVVATLRRHDRVRAELERSLDPDAQTLVSFLASRGVSPADDHDPGATVDEKRRNDNRTSRRWPHGPVDDSAFCGFTPREPWRDLSRPRRRAESRCRTQANQG